MKTDRERAEEWVRKNIGVNEETEQPDARDVDPLIEAFEEVRSEGRAQGIEEAAKVAEQFAETAKESANEPRNITSRSRYWDIADAIRGIALLSNPATPAPASAPNTGVGDDGKQPIPSGAAFTRVHLPSALEVVEFMGADGRWNLEVHGYTRDVVTGEPTRIRTRGWQAKSALAEDLHALLMTWWDHELREQLNMEPHAPATPEGEVVKP